VLSWTITFIFITILVGDLGFGVIAGASAGISKILFYIF